jgi:TolB-like protein/DNA-binding winged helix-turn-helix (wHTH) protein
MQGCLPSHKACANFRDEILRSFVLPERYRFDSFEIDLSGFRLLQDGQALSLEPKALTLLIFLVENRGRLVERRELIDAVWGGAFVTDHVLNRAVGQIRKALADDARESRYIETVPTRGYRFIAEVKVENASDTDAQPEIDTKRGATFAVLGSDPDYGKMAKRKWVSTLLGVVLIAGAAAASVLWMKAPTRPISGDPPIRSLAVLPLENLSGDSSQEYVADGVTAQLISSLAQIRALRVISQTTAMQYKNAHKPLPQIAKELNVDAVIEGSVLRSNDQLRVAAQLVDAPDDKQLWAGNFDRNLADVEGLENQVASGVAERIRIELSPQERTQLADSRRVDPRALEAFFKGNAALDTSTLEGVRAGLLLFEQAVEIDPRFARAYVGLAKNYNYLAGWGGFSQANGMAVGEATGAADKAIAKALEIDPELGEAYEERAWTLMKFRWDFPSAEAGYRKALEFEPGAASAHDGLGLTLLIEGRFEEALLEQQRAQEIDPLSLITNTDYCRALDYARQKERAVAQCDATVRLNPNYNYGVFMAAELHERLGDYAEGHRLWGKVDGGCDAYCLAMVDEIHGAPGVNGAFETYLKRRKDPPPPFFMARAYALLHREDQAFEWLEKSYELRSDVFAMCFLPVDPDFDSLRSDPRFDAFLKHAGLPPQPASWRKP